MNKELLFTMQRQLQDNWCWAATSTSVSLFYNSHSPWTQCKVANTTLGRNDCCTSPNPNPCNKSWYLDRALTTTQNFAGPIQGNPLTIAAIQAQIDAGKLIGVRIEWTNGDGHFVAIHGYNTPTNDTLVYVGDPIYGKSLVKLATFISNYQQAGGQWTHTYFTKSQPQVLQFTNINDNLLQLASQIRPELEKNKQEKINFSAATPVKLSMPHEIYLIDYDSLKQEDIPQLKQVGFRVIDSEEGDHRLIYDFDNSSANASLQQVIHDTTYTLPYRMVLENINEKQASLKESYSLRVVRQPALKVEAFWLHQDEDPQQDHFIPLSPASLFTINEVYPAKAFYDILKKAATEKKVNKDPLLGG